MIASTTKNNQIATAWQYPLELKIVLLAGFWPRSKTNSLYAGPELP